MITLIYPYSRGLEKNFGAGVPLGLLYLATILNNNGLPTEIIDFAGEFDQENLIVQKIVAAQPSLIGLPAYIFGQSILLRVIAEIRKCGYRGKIVLGAQFSRQVGEDLLRKNKSIDYVLMHEAEYSLLQLARKVVLGQGELKTIENLIYCQDDEIIQTKEVTGHNSDLDLLPIPDRALLERYFQQGLYDRPYVLGRCDYIVTSRGCKYSCYFCTPSAQKYRARSAENVLQELRYLKVLGRKHIEIMDDSFLTDKPRALAILKGIIQEKLNLSFKVRARVDQLDEEIFILMYKAGVRKIVLGIESGSDRMLRLMNKRTTVAQNRYAITSAKKHGFEVFAHFFIGFPGESLLTIKETFDFLLKVKPHMIKGGVYYPVPGTVGYQKALTEGTLRGEWGGTDNSLAWVQLPWLANSLVLGQMLAVFRRKYYANPIVLFNLLQKLNLIIMLKYFGRLRLVFNSLTGRM